LNGSILVVSGPSGSGKTSLCKKLCAENDAFFLSVSTTTRGIREGEVDGIDYHFSGREQFLEEIEADNFIEWAEVHGNFYGTSKRVVEEQLAQGKTIVFDIDVQGHDSIRKIYDKITTSIFVTTDTRTTLRTRLEGRGTDNTEVIDKRIINAIGEMRHIERYDYLVINDDFDASYAKIAAVGLASKVKQSMTDLSTFVEYWKEH